MTVTLTNLLRYTVLLIAGFVFGLIAFGAMLGTDTKHLLNRVLGMTHKGAVADATSCTVPTEKSKEVYFVSCGGFF